jgi:multidrug efflux pump subunit AcrB
MKHIIDFVRDVIACIFGAIAFIVFTVWALVAAIVVIPYTLLLTVPLALFGIAAAIVAPSGRLQKVIVCKISSLDDDDIKDKDDLSEQIRYNLKNGVKDFYVNGTHIVVNDN